MRQKKSFASKILDVVLVYSKTDYLFTSTKRKGGVGYKSDNKKGRIKHFSISLSLLENNVLYNSLSLTHLDKEKERKDGKRERIVFDIT